MTEYLVHHPSGDYRVYHYSTKVDDALVVQGDIPEDWHAEPATWNPYDDSTMPRDVERWGVIDDIATNIFPHGIFRVLIFHCQPGEKVDFFTGRELSVDGQRKVSCDLIQSGVDVSLLVELHWNLLEEVTLCGGDTEL